MPDLLREGLAALGVADVERAAGLLGAYLDEIERWNPRFGLVSVRSREELVVKHALDCVAGWTAVRDALPAPAPGGPPGTVLDAGSGAGLPGIPLAIVMPGARFRLVERMARRCSFMKTSALLLRLSNVTVEESDVRSAGGACDIVTFRAYAPVERFIAESLDGGAPGGPAWSTLIAYKGRQEKAREELEAARAALGPGFEALVVPVQVPFLDEERCLAVLRRPRPA